MMYALLASLRVGDSMQLSSASRQELFRVIAIERDVDELARRCPGAAIPARSGFTRDATTSPTGYAGVFFRHRGLAISATQVRRTLWASPKHSYRMPTHSRT
jgi:hypothetical protein